MSELGAGPLRLDDVPALLELFHGYDRRFFGEPLMDADDLQAELADPELDLALDSIALRTRDGTLVAGGFVAPRGQLDAQFAAGWDRPEVRERVVGFGEARGRERGLDAVSQFVAAADDAGTTWLVDRGYLLDHTSWILRLDEDAPITGRPLPAGYRVRPFALGDAEAAYAVVRDAFGEWDAGPERSFASWSAGTLGRPNVDPAAFRVATYQGAVVGACIVFDGADEAWVAQLAVAREHRGRGVAQQLLASAYAAARERGLPYAGLSTDSRTGALDLYLRLGMRVLFTLNSYRLELSG